ncbi:MAG TPA: hypothetical protein VK186_27125 [Candidatus Deferrimicrobium sp.]|nr:hypothetical protein [Candidatus Deferrimicrobium sp.]
MKPTFVWHYLVRVDQEAAAPFFRAGTVDPVGVSPCNVWNK